MTLDEAIKHTEEVADLCEYEASKYDMSDSYESHVACQEGKCAEEHRQLAEWLKDYKRLLEQEPCEEAISRAEILDELNRLGRNAFKDDTDYDNFFAFVDSLSPVTPQQKTGHWIYKTTEGQFCSICDGQSVWKFNYCPNCGAKMKEVEE